MKAKIIFFNILFLTTLLMNACQESSIEEKNTAFSMSDKMLSMCEFYVAENQIVKDEIRLFGKITADNNKLAQVYPIVSGIVKSINVELGDYVQQGQVLASIQSAEVATFRKEKLDAQNDVAIAEKNLQVAKDLFGGKLNSEKDVSVAEKELQKAKAELLRINEIYSIYNLKGSSEFSITAPISGFVVLKNINKNEQIRLDNSSPVFSIAEINEVWAVANVNESDISKINIGYSVSIKTLAFPDRIIKGTIDKIFNAIDPETKSMKVLAKIANPDLKLKPEMNCTVSVSYEEGMSMISIPSSAVIFDKNKTWVMVFKNKNNIETRKIEVYKQFGDWTYVKNGLKPGEKVISKNGLLIFDALND